MRVSVTGDDLVHGMGEHDELTACDINVFRDRPYCTCEMCRDVPVAYQTLQRLSCLLCIARGGPDER